MMKKLLVALFCASILFAPALAEARAGYSGGSYGSMGSRGSQTYNNNGAQPMQRSMTPQSGPYSSYGSGYGGGYGSHPFLSGLAGGFLGGWIGSMMFPHWGGYGYGGYGGGGGMGIIGTLVIWLLIIWGISRLFRMFRRGGPAFMSGGPGAYSGGVGSGGPGVYPAGGGYYGGGAGPMLAQLALTPSDQAAFEGVLKAVQGAWGKGDLQTLRHYVTPEMLSYFSEQLAQNQSRGVENQVEQVELIQGDQREAWDEGGMQYATTYLHWRAIDYTVRVGRKPGDPDYIVDGDPNRPTEAQEVWTFARVPGGHWLLSAIQQV